MLLLKSPWNTVQPPGPRTCLIREIIWLTHGRNIHTGMRAEAARKMPRTPSVFVSARIFSTRGNSITPRCDPFSIDCSSCWIVHS